MMGGLGEVELTAFRVRLEREKEDEREEMVVQDI